MRRSVIIAMVASLALATQGTAQEATADARLQQLAARLYPSLETLASSPELWRSSPAIAELRSERDQRLDACGADQDCFVRQALWREEELRGLAGEAAKLARLDPADLRRELEGVNRVLAVYAQNGRPAYPDIDGPDPDEPARLTRARIAAALAYARLAEADERSRLDPSIALSLSLLDMTGRLDAIAFGPFDAPAHNGPAAGEAKRIDWAAYPYTALIVPGQGPDDLETRLSPMAKVRLRLAADHYAQGLAPFIIVSGGAVHPRGTRAIEAEEMRRELVERFGIPANRVLIDPYARHTTTNLRNAARILFTVDAPEDRPALIVTSTEQSAYIESPGFATRNERELGYQPGRIGPRVSAYALPFHPERVSLRTDPADPLDP
jgi:hypothetical protein